LYDTIVSVMDTAAVGAAAVPVSPGGGSARWVEEGPANPPAWGSRPRVLVAEDNLVNQKVAVHLLEARGCRVDVADNGRAALDAVARTPYALVFMDCQMPELDGYEATAALRARESGAQHTPVVAMTAGAMVGEREKCLAAGMDDYITKPVTGEVLDRVLQRWLWRAATPAPAEAAPTSAPSAAEAEGILARLRSLEEMGPGFVSTFVSLFVEDTTAQMANLDAAVARGDAAAAQRLAHSLKGASSNVGADAMATLCGQIEDRARAGALADLPAAVRRLHEEYGRVRRVLADGLDPPNGEQERTPGSPV